MQCLFNLNVRYHSDVLKVPVYCLCSLVVNREVGAFYYELQPGQSVRTPVEPNSGARVAAGYFERVC